MCIWQSHASYPSYSVASGAREFVVGLPTHVKQLFLASSRVETMALSQILIQAREIKKDETSADEEVAVAAQVVSV